MKLLHLRSSTPGSVPTPAQIEEGQIAINDADGKLFIKKNDGSVMAVASGGEATNPAWPAPYDSGGTQYTPGSASEVATRDLVREVATDIIIPVTAVGSKSVHLTTDDIAKKVIVLTGTLSDPSKPFILGLPPGGEWIICNQAQGSAHIFVTNDGIVTDAEVLSNPNIGGVLILEPTVSTSVATSADNIYVGSGGFIGTLMQPIPLEGGNFSLNANQMLYQVIALVDNPLGTTTNEVDVKLPMGSTGIFTFYNQLAQSSNVPVTINGARMGQFDLYPGVATTFMHDSTGILTQIVSNLGTMAYQQASSVNITGGMITGLNNLGSSFAAISILDTKIIRLIESEGGINYYDFTSSGGNVNVDFTVGQHVINTPDANTPVKLQFNSNPNGDGYVVHFVFNGGAKFSLENTFGFNFVGWNPAALTDVPDGFDISLVYRTTNKTLYRM